jgi:hypothetical protein
VLNGFFNTSSWTAIGHAYFETSHPWLSEALVLGKFYSSLEYWDHIPSTAGEMGWRCDGVISLGYRRTRFFFSVLADVPCWGVSMDYNLQQRSYHFPLHPVIVFSDHHAFILLSLLFVILYLDVKGTEPGDGSTNDTGRVPNRAFLVVDWRGDFPGAPARGRSVTADKNTSHREVRFLCLFCLRYTAEEHG